MTRYTTLEQTRDDALIAHLLAELDKLRNRCGDVIALPICITLHDVAEMRLDTAKGPQRVGDVCTRSEMVAILHALADNPFGDPSLVLHYTLDDLRKQNDNPQPLED